MSFLLINKPEGWTSFDAVAFVRNKVRNGVILNPPKGINSVKDPLKPNERDSSAEPQNNSPKKLRVGHAGTLDPFATGLLIIGVGRESTRNLDEFKRMKKIYIATIKFGETSDTYDKTGKIEKTNNPKTITEEQILEAIKSFTGKQLQIPPMFSAKKINGQRLYTLARKGIEVERQPNEIEIYEIKLLDYTWPVLKIEVQCSAGTYIRTLAHDLGQKLGTGAFCQELVRTQIGDYLLTNAINLDTLK